MAGDPLTRVRTADIRAGLTVTDSRTGTRYTVRTVHASRPDNRCAVCHRSAHAPGMPTGNHGHPYAAPKLPRGAQGSAILANESGACSVSFRALRAHYLRRNLRALL